MQKSKGFRGRQPPEVGATEAREVAPFSKLQNVLLLVGLWGDSGKEGDISLTVSYDLGFLYASKEITGGPQKSTRPLPSKVYTISEVGGENRSGAEDYNRESNPSAHAPAEHARHNRSMARSSLGG